MVLPRDQTTFLAQHPAFYQFPTAYWKLTNKEERWLNDIICRSLPTLRDCGSQKCADFKISFLDSVSGLDQNAVKQERDVKTDLIGHQTIKHLAFPSSESVCYPAVSPPPKQQSPVYHPYRKPRILNDYKKKYERKRKERRHLRCNHCQAVFFAKPTKRDGKYLVNHTCTHSTRRIQYIIGSRHRKCSISHPKMPCIEFLR